ncbi:MAG: hypothetical protein KDK48_06215, partial [Chlamydiia bacterium]|nr:hypothetical protein [Chlamydiia bacterium]
MNVSPVETAPLTRAEVLERVQGIVDLPSTIRPVADYAAAAKALPALRPLLEKDEELLSVFRKASEIIESALPPSLAATPTLCPPEKVELSKYRPPCFLIPEIALTFELSPEETIVTCKMKVEWSYGPSTLVLNGEKQPIDSIEIDGRTLMPDEYRLFQDKLVLFNVPLAFELTICTRLNPSENKSASGLYMTDGLFATHCEPEAFRKIAYHPDRPDILSTYDVTLIADAKQCPVLLSNGDCVESSDLEDGRHLRRFVDPIPKPSYLFALVAGDLATVEDTFITGNGREIQLAIFAAAKYTSGLAPAMEALKSVMRWDEETYGRTYRHNEMRMIALDDFNAGACECTSLIMFNADCLVAHPKWSSDMLICDVVRTIAHEYIHYWNGNAVTIRSWHEL